jgi:hypothetical protein
LSGPSAIEDDVFGALLAGQSFANLANTYGLSLVNCTQGSPNAYAMAVVQILLCETDLVQLVDRDSLVVSVGTGNWISWSFQLHPAATDPASIISKLWTSEGKPSFRRCWRPTGKSLSFRSRGAPSLHLQVGKSGSQDERARVVRGHVDTADPWSHPLKHLVEDYLPAIGVGRHPGPAVILNSLPGRRK